MKEIISQSNHLDEKSSAGMKYIKKENAYRGVSTFRPNKDAVGKITFRYTILTIANTILEKKKPNLY